MSATRLRKLTVSHLRGAVQEISIPFSPLKRITIVYGENGSGKTTICDALDFIGNERVGSLEERGLGNPQRYWHSIGGVPTDIRVVLEATDGDCTARLVGPTVIVEPKALQPRVLLVRRQKLTQLIEARPADRFKVIQSYVDVSEFEKSEGELRALVQNLEKGSNSAVGAIGQAVEIITTSWRTAAPPVQDPMVWAKELAELNEATTTRERNALAVVQKRFETLNECGERAASALANLGDAQRRLETARLDLQLALDREQAGSAELLALLRAGEKYLGIHPSSEVCPLCESPDKAEGLALRVAERAQLLEELRKVNQLVSRAELELAQAQAVAEALLGSIASASAEFATASKDVDLPSGLVFPTSPCPSDLKAAIAWLSAAATLKNAWAQAAKTRQDAAALQATVRKALESHTSMVSQQTAIAELLPVADAALTILGNERRSFVDKVLAGIAEEVGRIYEVVHPGEGLNKVALALDPKKLSSLEVNASFGGKSVPPGAYFSQSHLDTLGLCVLLALAKLEATGETILVLDDVLASVDEPHVDRLVEMLYAEGEKFRHCVLTTHYLPWREKLRWGYLKNKECHFVELNRWSQTAGLSLAGSIPEVDLLRAALKAEPLDRQAVASKAGLILEAVLDFLTQLYECRIPRRVGGRYTIGDLLSALEAKLRSALKVDVLIGLDADQKPIYSTEFLAESIKQIEEVFQTRNLMGAHFSELGMNFKDDDALKFGSLVVTFMDLLTHPEEGWPRSKKSGSHWSTSGDSRRLHPLQRPQ